MHEQYHFGPQTLAPSLRPVGNLAIIHGQGLLAAQLHLQKRIFGLFGFRAAYLA